jgi:hypothetical protein
MSAANNTGKFKGTKINTIAKLVNNKIVSKPDVKVIQNVTRINLEDSFSFKPTLNIIADSKLEGFEFAI